MILKRWLPEARQVAPRALDTLKGTTKNLQRKAKEAQINSANLEMGWDRKQMHKIMQREGATPHAPNLEIGQDRNQMHQISK